MTRPFVRAVTCLILSALVCSAQEAEVGKLNQGVVKFARDHLGKKVGDGECTSLAIQALESVGARTTSDFGVSGLDKDYKWGTLVENHGDAKPGDIVQFRDFTTVTKTVTRTGKGTITRTVTRSYDHHTAVIARNLGKGKLEVYEQNSGAADATDAEKKKVQKNPLDLAGKTGGKVWIYRPVKK